MTRRKDPLISLILEIVCLGLKRTKTCFLRLKRVTGFIEHHLMIKFIISYLNMLFKMKQGIGVISH